MRRLNRRRLPSGRDRGAAAIIVALVCSFVLLGIGAVVVNVGAWYAERAQLQNGADGSALAVAQSCARGACDVSIAASKYAPENNNGELSNQNSIASGFPCGFAPNAAPGLPTCDHSLEDGTTCPKYPGANNPYVTVHTQTSKKMPSILGAFVGDNKSRNVLACAQVRWGAAGFNGGIAITISKCEWAADTNNGNPASYAPAPPYPPYPSLVTYPEKKIELANIGSSNKAGCTDALPGGFGEVNPNGGDPCSASFSSSGWYDQSTGNGNSDQWVHTCQPVFDADRTGQVIVQIPVYDGVQSQGNNGQFHLTNLAGFVITGYYFKTGGGGTVASYIPNSPYGTTQKIKAACTNTCIVGYYVQAQVNGNPGGGQNYGVTSKPKLTG